MSFLKELRERNIERAKFWDPENKLDLLFFSNELGNEAGEAQGEVKKIVRHLLGIRGGKDTSDDLAKEVADVMIVLDLLCWKAGIDIEEVTRKKFNETSRKYNLPTLIGE